MTDAPAWSRGFELDFLKEVAALYRDEFKPLTFGAFGIPKERDVADAMAEDALIWTRARDGNKPVVAAAVYRPVRQPTKHHDFAGRAATMQPGDLFARSIAGSIEGKRRILAKLLAAGAPAVWVEAHVELEETGQLLAELGFRRTMTKVMAASELKGLYVKTDRPGPRLPVGFSAADQVGVRVLAEGFLSPADHMAIVHELMEHLGHKPDAFSQHYSGYNKGRSWSAFALRGYDHGDPGFIIKPAEMSREWKKANPLRLADECGPTSAAPFFDATWKALGAIPGGDFQRVRFMRLTGGGGELTRHADITDPEAGTGDGEIARLHIPIFTNPACLFRSWGLDGREERLHLPERCLAYLDTRKPHAVINPGEAERVHLVVDVRSSRELRDMITDAKPLGAGGRRGVREGSSAG